MIKLRYFNNWGTVLWFGMAPSNTDKLIAATLVLAIFGALFLFFGKWAGVVLLAFMVIQQTHHRIKYGEWEKTL